MCLGDQMLSQTSEPAARYRDVRESDVPQRTRARAPLAFGSVRARKDAGLRISDRRSLVPGRSVSAPGEVVVSLRRDERRMLPCAQTEVISVGPETSVHALAALLSERGISGVPVVDADNRVVGIVSEGDLLHRIETGTQQRTTRRRSWWIEGSRPIASWPATTSSRMPARSKTS
jgi:hypothetical protein